MFCPECGSMMFPKDGKYICRGCEHEEEIKGSEKVKTEANGADVAVVDEKTVTLPKTRVICPKCEYTEAYYDIRQTRSADEPPTTIYRCCKCKHSWREY